MVGYLFLKLATKIQYSFQYQNKFGYLFFHLTTELDRTFECPEPALHGNISSVLGLFLNFLLFPRAITLFT